jgi:hypothetical protein
LRDSLGTFPNLVFQQIPTRDLRTRILAVIKETGIAVVLGQDHPRVDFSEGTEAVVPAENRILLIVKSITNFIRLVPELSPMIPRCLPELSRFSVVLCLLVESLPS